MPATEDTLARFRAGTLYASYAIELFVQNPDDLDAELRAWRPDERWPSAADYRMLLARRGEPAVDAVRHIVKDRPQALAPILMPVVDLHTARLMAGWLHRRADTRDTARAWFVRHRDNAIRLLVPDALGTAGPARNAAEHALRAVAGDDGVDLVRDVTAHTYGPAAAAAVAALLTVDPLTLGLPARLPAIPSWATPAVLPQITLRAGGALPASAVGHVLTMLAICKPAAPYAGLAVVKDACTRDSLDTFVWALFEAWRIAGMPAKEAWAFFALGRLGNDATAARLDPIVRAWPLEGVHKRAADGVDILAAIGTDGALRILHDMSQRVRQRALRTNAQAKIAEVAVNLGLSDDQLAARLVPFFGLDANGTTVVDYGTRTFTVGFDEQLRPVVVDADGTRRKDLPAPGARDDADLATAERKRFTALKKQVRTAASDAVKRLERAMVRERTWTVAEFRDLVVAHPLISHLARRLVWAAEHDGTLTGFRVAEDGTYANAADIAYALPDHATVRVAHPLLLGTELDAWAEVFADYEILQPFPQLGRPVHRLADDENADAALSLVEGRTVAATALLSLERHGWQREAPGQGGYQCRSTHELGDGWKVFITYETSLHAGAPQNGPDQTITQIGLAHSGESHSFGRSARSFAELGPVRLSELLTTLTELTGGAI